jgi:NADPH2:quinone reductase
VTDVRAAVCLSYGGPDVVRVQQWDAPAAGPGQVKVRVRAAAVNFPDVLVVAGRYQIKLPVPFVVGSEFAGVVEDVGAGVTSLEPGTRVFGTGLFGAFADYAVAPVTAVTRTPDRVDDASAAAFGVAHRTAYNVLRSVARVEPGGEVVVLGAGGGVGLATVQLAAAMGATVTAVASSNDKLSVAAAEGAARVVNHRDGDLRAALRDALPGGADVVVDPVGGQLAEPALRSLRPGGRFVTVGYASGEIPRIPLNLVLLKGVTVAGFEFLDFATRCGNEMERNEVELLAMLADGDVVPYLGARFPLADVASALRLVGDGGAIGKVVITMNGGSA